MQKIATVSATVSAAVSVTVSAAVSAKNCNILYTLHIYFSSSACGYF